ncbi:FAD-linked oxidase C-terminal domain-containing protein [Streptomyces sp. NPDC050619]|uniref:FAD-binding and (Fe-S)-binding domain-containing protein n=1 Tax=Streptomyces sp. NPDC050619 TaxID=3157214 RepID=UPI00341728B5
MHTVEMDPKEVVATLRAAGVTEVDASTRRRAEYATDASLYRVVPAAVAFPRGADDVAAALAVCHELGVPLTARGAGTSIAGNAVGSGVVLDFSRHLTRIRHVDAESRTAVVEPGVVLDDLQRAAGAHGLRFGPDPSTHSRCTIGGMIGNNACGSRALGYGRTADNVVELDVLTGGGERLTAVRSADPRSSPTLSKLQEVVRANLGPLRTEFGRFGRQVSGYSLEHLLPERGFDVARALVGTEGTCGVLLSATVRLVAVPARTSLVVLGYPDLATAADAVPHILAHSPVAVEGLDARMVDVVRARRGADAVPPLPKGGGWLFVELSDDDESALAVRQSAVVAADTGASGHRIITDPAQAAALWRIREDGAGLAARSQRGRAAHAGWEDAAVPPERLGAYLREFEALLTDHELTGTPYGHFGDGCVHVRIDFPLTEPRGPVVFRDFLLEAAKLVARYGGSLSGEHGDGRARGELLPLMYSSAALRAISAVKDVFDPAGVLNPGVIVRPRPLDADLRTPAAHPIRTDLAFGYREDAGDFTAAVHRCTGVGKCRADPTGDGEVMCPSYRATRDEKDSTRGRARVLQEMAVGSLVPDWRAPAVREALDLCLACKGCASDCPTGVDMAMYKAEALYQAYRHRPRPPAHYALGSLPTWSRLASLAPGLVNRATYGPLAAPGKRMAGVDPRRGVPPFARQTFRRWFSEHRRERDRVGDPGDPVLLWVDTFTDHFTPQVGIAAVRVLEHAGFAVRIPRKKLCCGLTWISTGRLDTARRILRRSVAQLRPLVADGIPVVGLEPSCTAVFRSDALELLAGDPAAQEVARGVRTLAEHLASRAGWEPPNLDGVRVVAQPHCHQHAVMGWEHDRELLTRAGSTVRRVGGCCGQAGNFGTERGHYDVSVAIAESALLPAVREAGPDAVVLTDGFSCRTQLSDLGAREGVHLAELLASRLE